MAIDRESNVVGGVGSFGLTPYCTGNGFYYRVDTEYVQDWLFSNFSVYL